MAAGECEAVRISNKNPEERHVSKKVGKIKERRSVSMGKGKGKGTEVMVSMRRKVEGAGRRQRGADTPDGRYVEKNNVHRG
jgi:hypothetical protein